MQRCAVAVHPLHLCASGDLLGNASSIFSNRPADKLARQCAKRLDHVRFLARRVEATDRLAAGKGQAAN